MKRILCISDIHGMYQEFMSLLDKVNYDSNTDQLILLGDYVDRGPCNMKTLYKVLELKEKGAIVLKGNHDKLAENSIEDLLDGRLSSINILEHLMCDGEFTLNELKFLDRNQLIYLHKSLKQMLYYYELENYIFVHSGINSLKHLDENNEEDFLWSRLNFIEKKAYDNKITVFGHTPTIIIKNEHTIWYDNIYKDKIGIDCGSVYGGKLACLELPSKKEYYI